jgi:hypothetical protein
MIFFHHCGVWDLRRAVFHLAIPRSTNGVDHLRDPKRTLRRAEPDAVPDAERKPDADHHDRVEHRRGLPRQSPGELRAPGRGYPARAQRTGQ